MPKHTPNQIEIEIVYQWEIQKKYNNNTDACTNAFWKNKHTYILFKKCRIPGIQIVIFRGLVN